jgi:hypothetical protein
LRTKRSLFLVPTACVLVFGIAGCGGSGADAGVKVNTSIDTANVQLSDAFVGKVLQLISTTTEHDEPNAIESISVTSPDNTEPVPIS